MLFFLNKSIIFIAKILVWSVSTCLISFILYTTMLRAETIPDPLSGYDEVHLPKDKNENDQEIQQFISIPVPYKSIRKGAMINKEDLKFIKLPQEAVSKMMLQNMNEIMGKEAKVTLYKNQPILPNDIGSITIIKRNDLVTLHFQKGTLILKTSGRAMENGGTGDIIKVMNLESKKTISGMITENGEVDVSI